MKSWHYIALGFVAVVGAKLALSALRTWFGLTSL